MPDFLFLTVRIVKSIKALPNRAEPIFPGLAGKNEEGDHLLCAAPQTPASAIFLERQRASQTCVFFCQALYLTNPDHDISDLQKSS